jgi:hypothetical protein
VKRRRSQAATAVAACGLLVAAMVAATGGTYAALTSNTSVGGNVVTAATDFRAPTIASTAVVKSAGGTAGFVKKSGTYRVYANVTDTGNPASGLSSVTADVSALNSGQTAVPLVAGSYTAGGVTYNYASASLTAGASITEGSKSFSVTAADNASNSGSVSGSVTVDNTVPTGTNVQGTNGSGGTARRIERNDVLTLTVSEPIEPGTIVSGWTGASTNVVVRLVNNGSSDQLQIWNSTNGAQLPLGTVTLGRTDFVGSTTITYGASGTASTMTMSGNTITIVLGTASAAATTAGGTGTLRWTPSSTPTDRAGNSLSTAQTTESGTADGDF